MIKRGLIYEFLSIWGCSAKNRVQEAIAHYEHNDDGSGDGALIYHIHAKTQKQKNKDLSLPQA